MQSISVFLDIAKVDKQILISAELKGASDDLYIFFDLL